MTVPKRTRFEVLKRDNHACRYCGQTAPEVRITVDHVIPVALGGDDSPTNLVAACFDCNLGKASTAPDGALVAEVSEAALRYSKLAKAAWAVRVAKIDERNDYIDRIAEHITFAVPTEWRGSIGRFFDIGVPEEVVINAAEIAAAKYSPHNNMDRFKYMCGVLHNQLREVQGAVLESLDMDGCWYTDEDLTEIRIDAYEQGAANAKERAKDAISGAWFRGLLEPDPRSMALHYVCEGTYPVIADDRINPLRDLASCG